MSDLTYEIRCPVCRASVPADAPRCPRCAATAEATRAAGANVSAVLTLGDAGPASSAAPTVAAGSQLQDVSTMKLKDYHRLVRENYGTVERRGAAAIFGGPFGPILLIVALGLIVAAAFAFHAV
jgi:hypothetical protein